MSIANTVKALINAWAFIRIINFHREGGGRFLEEVYLNNQKILFVLSLQYHV